jgi:hypothetical protein
MSSFKPFSTAGTADLPIGLTAEDVAALTNFPSIGRLFEKPELSDLNEMKARLNETFQNLERVVRRGSTDDARRAQTAIAAVTTALDFLQMLEQIQQNQAKK